MKLCIDCNKESNTLFCKYCYPDGYTPEHRIRMRARCAENRQKAQELKKYNWLPSRI